MADFSTGMPQWVADAFSIYPNPANEEINLTFGKEARYSIAIRNVTGETVLSTENYSAQTKIDVSMLPKGIYFVEVTNGNAKIMNKKIVKM
jgi:hypothetical protein